MGDTVDTSIKQIEELLNELYVPPSTLDMLTREDIKKRYPLTGLRGPAIPAIEQSRRIIRATGNYDNMGLFELHIGLVYLDFDQYKTAAHQFMEARRFWSFVDRTAASCLARFGQACSLYHANDGENAMIACGRGLRCLERFERHGVSHSQLGFAEKLRQYLTEQQELLRKSLHTIDQAPEATSVPPPRIGSHDGDRTGETPPDVLAPRDAPDGPIVSDEGSASAVPSLNAKTPVPGHRMIDDHYLWYQVVKDYAPHVPVGRTGTFFLVRWKEMPDSSQIQSILEIRFDATGTTIMLVPVGIQALGRRITLKSDQYVADFTRTSGRVYLGAITVVSAISYALLEFLEAEVIGSWYMQ